MEIIGSIKNYPARILAVWYLALIGVGAALLMLPACQKAGAEPLSVLDVIFTSTSASCVTGLVVRSTGNDLSGLGQLVVLLLIQVGGIGIMTFTSYIIFSLGRSASLRDRAVFATTHGTENMVNLEVLLRQTLLITLIVESFGFVIFGIRNLVAGMPFGEALWHALFHTISAFCNAGFALQDNSLISYQGDIVVNLTLMTMIVVGGIGFPVILDLMRNWNGTWLSRWERLTLHSKLMLIGTITLISAGAVSFLILEWGQSLRMMPFGKRVMVSLFHSVTCRTAGFNSVDLASLTNATLFVSVLLMMVGGGAGSTAGGFKVSTLAILVLRSWNSLRGRDKVNAFRRTIPSQTVSKAIVTAMLFSVIAIIALTVLLAFEQSQRPHAKSQGLFLDAAFEIISALGTVGLSTGLTSNLSSVGRVTVIVLMYIGRLGPITVFAALSQNEQRSTIEYCSEEPLIG